MHMAITEMIIDDLLANCCRERFLSIILRFKSGNSWKLLGG